MMLTEAISFLERTRMGNAIVLLVTIGVGCLLALIAGTWYFVYAAVAVAVTAIVVARLAERRRRRVSSGDV